MGRILVINKRVSELKHIGSKKAALLNNLGITTIGDLLWHIPRRYEDRSKLKEITNAVNGEEITTIVTIISWEQKEIRPNLCLLKAFIQGKNGSGYAIWFNQSYLKRQLPAGTKVILTGKVNFKDFIPQIQVTDYEILGEKDNNLHKGRIVPFYQLTNGLTQRWFRAIIAQALELVGKDLPEILPQSFCKKYRLLSKTEALNYIHFPPNITQLYQAQRRLKYEELLIWELGLNLRRTIYENGVQGIAHIKDNYMVEKLIDNLSFSLTEAQKRVLGEIINDMEKPTPMARLLQGDVGSGKTIVAAGAIVKAVSGGWQTALMVPTEVLAEQHRATLEKLLLPLKIPVVSLTSNTPSNERRIILKKLATGELPVIVGTHALIQDSVIFKSLGLAIIDEQHRFGVGQRAALEAKGRCPDLLVLTATPIPRTLALTIYGDLDISYLDELPPGRKPVVTRILTETHRPKIYEFIRQEIKKGHQVYVICPLIEDSENINAKAAIAMAKTLSEEIFPNFNVGLVHGRLNFKEKETVMNDFRKGKINILVATTVVEIGVDVPNATVMLIEGAERLGLAQLHQLRGRVGRGQSNAYCFLMVNDSSYNNKRLRILTKSQDGFKISEYDLRLRGPGEFYGTRQHGMPEFRLAKIPQDKRILEQAKKDALYICQHKLWTSPEFQKLCQLSLEKITNLTI
ncbi:MAG: ATP-dependent helicase RecG [Clostridia bacterium]|nr:ATP-dependent helicase RecG [Clostridia bacterium]